MITPAGEVESATLLQVIVADVLVEVDSILSIVVGASGRSIIPTVVISLHSPSPTEFTALYLNKYISPEVNVGEVIVRSRLIPS